MKAILIHEFGDPGVMHYEETAEPIISPDEVLVKLHASGVNPIDWKVRKGLHKESYHLPLIIGWDMCGVIEETGKEVTQFAKKDQVYGRPNPLRNGTYAEYIAVKATELAFAPRTLDGYTAAAIPLAGLTAWQGIFEHGNLKRGQKILIQGAAGGVGTFAVQFARWKGAHVIGVSSEKNHQFLLGLGADEVVDYHEPGYEKKYRDIDLVLDTIGGETQKKSATVLKSGGALVGTVGITDKNALEQKGLRGIAFMAASLPEDLRKIAALVDQQEVRPVIEMMLPLPEAVKAHEISERGHVRGKIVLTITD